MKIKLKVKTWTVIVLATLSISGCVINPWYFDDDLVLVPELEGSWIPYHMTETDIWAIRPLDKSFGDKKAYELDKGQGFTGKDVLYFFKIEGQLYADRMDYVYYLAKQEKIELLEEGEVGYHNLFRIHISDSGFTAIPLNLEYFEGGVEKGIFNLPFKMVEDRSSDYNIGNNMLVTASTQQLQDFLSHHHDDTLLFNKLKVLSFKKLNDWSLDTAQRTKAIQKELNSIFIDSIKTECESYDALLKIATIVNEESVQIVGNREEKTNGQWIKQVIKMCTPKMQEVIDRREGLGFENHELNNCPSYDSLKILATEFTKPAMKEYNPPISIYKRPPEIREDTEELIAKAPPMPSFQKDIYIQPSFPGGKQKQDAFVNEHFQYPQQAIKEKIEGVVYVKFWIEVDGAISDIQVESSVGGGCEEEAVRIVKLMPKWEPGTINGKKTRMSNTLFVRFILE